MKRFLSSLIIVLLSSSVVGQADWAYWGSSHYFQRYSPAAQINSDNVSDLENLNIDFSQEYILEKMINLKKEFSIILTRFGHSIHSVYEPIENEHENQILKYSKTPAQIILRWLNQQNWIVIPKSSNKKRLIENLNIFDFTIDENDMNSLHKLDKNYRVVPSALGTFHQIDLPSRHTNKGLELI